MTGTGKRTRTRTYYLHTIDGKPATCSAGYVVVIPDDSSGVAEVLLARDLRQIRREQARSRRWDREHGIAADEIVSYGYVLVRLPDPERGR